MAEFVDVLRQFDRMCKSNAGCFNCPLHEPDGVSDRCSIGAFINDSERIEREVMSWAAEHPEPVYETWGQYFRRRYGLEYCKGHEMLLESIPADIAQKLGIEPLTVLVAIMEPANGAKKTASTSFGIRSRLN